MGKAVGGASAAGCGIFGLAGILISVGLVVWLGSQATTNVGGATHAPDSSGAQSLESQASALVNPSTPGVAGRDLQITAPGKLDNGGVITVAGADFDPGPIEVTSCVTHLPANASGSTWCDPSTTAVATVLADRSFALSYPAKRIITVEGTAYDCAAFFHACSIVAHPKGAFDKGSVRGLTFSSDLPADGDAMIPPTS